MTIRHFDILPIPKPRQTQRDRRRYSAKVQRTDPHALRIERYRAYADECRWRQVQLPEADVRVVFFLPMPAGWSASEKRLHRFRPMQRVPDFDNLIKALADAVYDDDRRVWDVRTTKVWSPWYGIAIAQPAATELSPMIDEHIAAWRRRAIQTGEPIDAAEAH